jgi:hypothetical protein
MVRVQEKKNKVKGKEYTQLWIPLPKKLCDALGIEKGTELKVFVERGDLILRRI